MTKTPVDRAAICADLRPLAEIAQAHGITEEYVRKIRRTSQPDYAPKRRPPLEGMPVDNFVEEPASTGEALNAPMEYFRKQPEPKFGAHVADYELPELPAFLNRRK